MRQLLQSQNAYVGNFLMFTPQGFLMSQLPVSMQVTTPSAMNLQGFSLVWISYA